MYIGGVYGGRLSALRPFYSYSLLCCCCSSSSSSRTIRFHKSRRPRERILKNPIPIRRRRVLSLLRERNNNNTKKHGQTKTDRYLSSRKDISRRERENVRECETQSFICSIYSANRKREREEFLPRETRDDPHI